MQWGGPSSFPGSWSFSSFCVCCILYEFIFCRRCGSVWRLCQCSSRLQMLGLAQRVQISFHYYKRITTKHFLCWEHISKLNVCLWIKRKKFNDVLVQKSLGTFCTHFCQVLEQLLFLWVIRCGLERKCALEISSSPQISTRLGIFKKEKSSNLFNSIAMLFGMFMKCLSCLFTY